MSNVFVFDIETTGLPKYKNIPPFKQYNFESSRIIEIGYIILSNDGVVLKERNTFVKYAPETDIQNSHIHGITNDMVQEDGIDIKDLFTELNDDLKKVHTIVAHNLEFDYNILLSEIYRHYNNNRDLLGQIYSKQLYCTMKEGQRLMNVKKYPKLVELNKYLFDKDWAQTHRALDDVKVCMNCYMELQKRTLF